MKTELTIDFICKVLTEQFETPCNYSPLDEEMCDRYWDEWCAQNCSEKVYPLCWRKMFEKELEQNETD